MHAQCHAVKHNLPELRGCLRVMVAGEVIDVEAADSELESKEVQPKSSTGNMV